MVEEVTHTGPAGEQVREDSLPTTAVRRVGVKLVQVEVLHAE